MFNMYYNRSNRLYVTLDILYNKTCESDKDNTRYCNTFAYKLTTTIGQCCICVPSFLTLKTLFAPGNTQIIDTHLIDSYLHTTELHNASPNRIESYWPRPGLVNGQALICIFNPYKSYVHTHSQFWPLLELSKLSWGVNQVIIINNE